MTIENNKPQGEKIGILLLNLGTPDGTDFWSVRRYLKEFLSDRRVVDMARWQWWPILNLIILNVRPQKSGALYDKIWDKESGDSPLRLITARQAEKLSSVLSDHNVVVDFAMRYGNPSIETRLDALKKAGCTRILAVPLYPQYSSPTTGSVNQQLFEKLGTMRWQPALRTVPPYFNDGTYIGALAQSIRAGFEKLEFEPEKLVISFHGMPQSFVEKGDPYFDQCQVTAGLLSHELGWSEGKIVVGFQSRFGREPWLQPYFDKMLENFPSQGVKKVAVISPGFSADCLETLEELAIAGREDFLEAGGEDYAYIPCLNDSELGMELIEKLVAENLEGWV